MKFSLAMTVEVTIRTSDLIAKGWDLCVAKVRATHPDCTDDCDACIARDDVLADITPNPYRTKEDR